MSYRQRHAHRAIKAGGSGERKASAGSQARKERGRSPAGRRLPFSGALMGGGAGASAGAAFKRADMVLR
jgi:hypothetical protein